MVTYQFYLNDGSGETELIGILPERRKHRKRITRESILKWGQLAAGTYVDPKKIRFVEIDAQNEL
jgi:hypothetical protein